MIFMKLTYRKGIVDSAMKIAIGIILLIAIIVPFLQMGLAQGCTTASALGLPVAAWEGILLLILVVFIFILIKKGQSGVKWH